MEEYDLIILVYGCYTVQKYATQIQYINNTWGKKCEQYKNVKLLFFVGEEKLDKFNNSNQTFINLKGVKDDYLSASYKQFLGLKYIYENYKCNYIICVGTDTYINVPKLLQYIQKFDSLKNLYIGGHGCHRKLTPDKTYYYHSGGPGFIITYTVLKNLYESLATIMDKWISLCTTNNNHYLIPACDVAISYFLQESDMNIDIVKTNDLSFIHCNYMGTPCHHGEINVRDIISCHSMSPDDFVSFTNILESNNYFI